jgi:hypothetical protein
MWCKRCGQDVPALSLSDEGGYVCPRCMENVLVRQSVPPRAEVDPRKDPIGALGLDDEKPRNAFTPTRYDRWEWDEQLRHIHRAAGGGQHAAPHTGAEHGEPTSAVEPARLDAARHGPPPHHFAPKRPRVTTKQRKGKTGGGLAVLSWTAITVGLGTFVCGGFLLGWSMVHHRPDVWNLGLPVAMGGQIVLLIGLVLQLEELWNGTSRTAATLDRVNQQLHDLQTTASRLNVHPATSASFYSHWAKDASPQILLSDLKSQLDLLAVKLADRK